MSFAEEMRAKRGWLAEGLCVEWGKKGNVRTLRMAMGLCAVLVAAGALRGAQAVAVGVVLEAAGGQIGGAPVTAGASVYGGDILSTDTEGKILLRVGKTRYELNGDTSAAFFPGRDGGLVELRHGTIIVSTNAPAGEAGTNFEIYVSDVRVVTKEGPVLAQVSTDSPCEILVTDQKGKVNVTSGNETKVVEETKTDRVVPEHSVSDDHKVGISPEDAEYHKHHTHGNCAAYAKQNWKPPVGAGSSHFLEVAGGAVAVLTLIPVIKALESPDRPN